MSKSLFVMDKYGEWRPDLAGVGGVMRTLLHDKCEQSTAYGGQNSFVMTRKSLIHHLLAGMKFSLQRHCVMIYTLGTLTDLG